ncbi:uncharacterized protein [Rutidosis leptorrhynchoides]|uniref:uncharacterized protein n=1 Tax=Rutidosis leptorrhynchoides TaxID=125765 RepID=UPI003A9A30D6
MSNIGIGSGIAVAVQASTQKRGRKRKSAKMYQNWQSAPISFPKMQSDDFSEMPIVVSCKVAETGITIMKVHVDNGSSVDIIYEQCFVQLPESFRATLQLTTASLTGFAGESSLPMGVLPLDVELSDENDDSLVRRTWLDFYVMRTSSHYNMLLGRIALGKFGIVPSTIHGMIKFAMPKGVATINSASIVPIYAAVNVKSTVQKIADVTDNMVVVNPTYPDQKIKVGCNVSADTKKQIAQLLVQYMDVFAWLQKRRGMAPDRAKWLCEEVTKLVRAGILREVQCQSWIANPVLVKKPAGSWRMCIDFKDLNKACPKDNYPLPEIDLKVESLHAFPYKYFLDAETGYHQIPMGIQANPKKITAIENMTATKTVKEEMKKLLKTLPTLTAPIDGKILYLYISVANEAFGSVLVTERDKIQKPVYFVSKALTGIEINYAPIEKFVYALILTSRRLRIYFQGHPVHVLTNMPIKQVLTKPEISGRLALWVVELGAYQISYLPRSAIKGQILADYLAEMTGELEVINESTELKPAVRETWDLFTDRASCAEGAGAGLVLASSSGEQHTYALRFNFDKYLQLLKELAVRFEHFELAQVPRSQNKKADALSKLAALTFSHFQKQVWVEELPSKSIDNDLMVASVIEEQPNLMEPILQYIRNDVLPDDKREARLVREGAPMYIIQNDILYRKSYCGPMMRCVGPIEAEMIIDEVHNGSYALHSGYKTIAVKIMRMGYF